MFWQVARHWSGFDAVLVVDVFVLPPAPAPDEVVGDVGAALPPLPTAVPALLAVPFAAADRFAALPLCVGGGAKISAVASQKQAMLTPTRKTIIKVRFTQRISFGERDYATRLSDCHRQSGFSHVRRQFIGLVEGQKGHPDFEHQITVIGKPGSQVCLFALDPFDHQNGQ